MNKINALFANNKDRKLLSLYFCAGCPTLEGTGDVIKAMERKGIDMIEVGIPFSDPLADVIPKTTVEDVMGNITSIFIQYQCIYKYHHNMFQFSAKILIKR